MKFTKCSKKGFTLIELLVVVSIIALLISILMPGLSKARESAKRVVCASKLSQVGCVFFLFSADHDGYMPKSFRHSLGDYGTCFPLAINDVMPDNTNGQLDDYSNGEWKKHGVPWDIFENYGMVESLVICPSQKWLPIVQPAGWPDDRLYFWEDGVVQSGWRRMVWQSYMFIAGMSDTENNRVSTPDSHNYQSTMQPYSKFSSKRPSSKVMAADTVAYFSDAWGADGMSGPIVNHQLKGVNGKQVSSQNILFADSHCENMSPSSYDFDLEEDPKNTMGNWSYQSGNNSWFYWEGYKNR